MIYQKRETSHMKGEIEKVKRINTINISEGQNESSEAIYHR